MPELDLMNPTTEAEWSALLDQTRQEFSKDEPRADLIAMLGEYRPMEAVLGRECPGFYVRKPKLRQRIALMRDMENVEAPSDGPGVLEYMVEVLKHVVYRPAGVGKMRNVTADELLDFLDDENETRKLASELLGLKLTEEEKGGSGPTPTTETSSDA